MSRSLKPLKVEDFIDLKRRIQVDLMLDRNTKQFFALVQLDKVEAPSIEQLREAVRAKVAHWKPLEWLRVIELDVGGEPSQGWGYRPDPGEFKAEVEVEFKRLEISKGMDGEWMQRPFADDLDEDKRKAQEEQPLRNAEACARWRMEKQIPYSDETWATLLEVSRVIDSARERLKKLFDPKDKGRALAGFRPAGLLPAGKAAAQ